MATVLDPKYWPNNVRIPQGDAEGHQALQLLALATGATNDVRKLFKLPRGLQITDCLMQTGDLDTGAGLVMSLRITNGTTTKLLIDSTTVGQAGGVIRPTKIITTENGLGFVTPDASYWVEILYNTQAAGAQAADVFIAFHFAGGAYTTGTITD